MNHDVQDRLLNWWEHGEQDRPCLLVYGQRLKNNPVESRCESLDDYWLKPRQHLERAVTSMQRQRFFGEALPYHYIDFGASALCGMQGCQIHYGNRETIWVDPLYTSLVKCLDARVCSDLTFSRSVRSTLELVSQKLTGHALVGPYCIGSPCDNLAGLIGTENFIFALYDEPELLEQALRLQLALWVEEFDFVNSVLQPSAGRPVTGWHGILAPGSPFPIQEDIGYMLGIEHYNQFCLPGIRAMVESMEYPFFHLDGIGALKHLDALLGIGRLKVIQWQPGDGHMQVNQWLNVVKKILAAGKSCQLYIQPDEVEPLVDRVGAKGLLLIINTDEEKALRLADKYHLEENMVPEGLAT